jgi:hypothetical protein
MTRHLLIVATAFRLAGILLGVASLTALMDITETWFYMRQMPPVETGPPLDIKTYGLVGLLSNAARGFGYGLHALAGLLSIIMAIVAVAAAFALLVAVLLYLTGSGVGDQANWARFVAILISIALAFASCGIMVAIRRDLAPLAALPIGFSLYALWVLLWRFA